MQGILSLFAMTWIVGLTVTAPVMAAAPTADVARKCRQLAILTHPTQRLGPHRAPRKRSESISRIALQKGSDRRRGSVLLAGRRRRPTTLTPSTT